MIATLVHVRVKEKYLEQFIKVTEENHLNAVQEAGNLRFDILQDASDPTKFILYEVYVSEQAAAAHKETPHYAKWRDAVADWMAEPRKGVKHNMLFPTS